MLFFGEVLSVYQIRIGAICAQSLKGFFSFLCSLSKLSVDPETISNN